MAESKLTCVCGRDYWPNQAWQHTACRAVIEKEPLPASGEDKKAQEGLVSPPRGWKTREEYKAYMRKYMRAYRKRKK